MQEVVSEIIISTTDVDPKTNILALFALEAQLQTVPEIGDGYEQFVIGSVADLNIKALLRCHNDINIMAQSMKEIAIPIGCKIPDDDYLRRLNRISVSLYRMQPTQDPGYVRLLTDGSLNCIPHTNPARYVYKPDQNSGFFVQEQKNFSKHTNSRNLGSASRKTFQYSSAYNTNHLKMHGKQILISSDSVKSILCPYWCSNDFCDRHRPHDWPTKDMVTEIVRKGCDLVLASDVNARNRSDTKQWRLSFSRAETLLMLTWTPVQKIVYHLLRYLRKKCLPVACSISSYDLKTLMLWNCEKQPHSYWETNVMAISSDLLGRLLKHVNDRHLPNYFIPQSNILKLRTIEGDSFGSSYIAVVATLTPFTRTETLGKWFLQNYIKVAAKQFYGTKSATMADDLVLIEHLDITELMSWLTEFFDTFLADYNQQISMEACLAVDSCVDRLVELCAGGKLGLDLCRKILDQLPQIDIRCVDVFRSVVFMEAASQTDQFGLNLGGDSMDVVAEVLIRSGKIDCSLLDQGEGDSALSYFKRATSLLCFVKCSTGVDDKLLLALSKAYFWKSLLCTDSGTVYCAVNAYLAAIFYQGKEIKLALHCCTLITSKDEHLSCSGYTIKPQLLPIINVLSNSEAEKELRSVSYDAKGKRSPFEPLSPETFANRLLSKIQVESEEGKTTSPGTMMPDIDTISSHFFTDEAKNPNSCSSYVASKKSVGLETLLFRTDFGIPSNVSQKTLDTPESVDSQEWQTHTHACPDSLTKYVGVSRKSKSTDDSYGSENSRPMFKSEELEAYSSTDISGNRITLESESALGSISTKTVLYVRTESKENAQRFQCVGSQYRKHTKISSESESGVLPKGTVESYPKVGKHQKRGREMVYCREQLKLTMYLNRATRSPQNIGRRTKREDYSKSLEPKSALYSRTDNHICSPADSNPECYVLKQKANEYESCVDPLSPNTPTYFDHIEANPDSYSSSKSKFTSSQFCGSVATTIRQDVVSALVKASVCHMTAFNKTLQNDPDISQHEQGAYPYMALYHFKSGHFQAALKICNDMINLDNVQSSDAISFNVICSPPFNLLLTHDLKMIVDECRSSSEIMTIDARFLGAYLSIQCLMNLDRSVVEIARILMQAYAFLLRSHASFQEVNSRIYFLLRENVLQRYIGIITEDHGNDSLSVLENGTLTNVGIRQDGAHIVLYTERHGRRNSKDLFSNVNENYVSNYDRYTM